MPSFVVTAIYLSQASGANTLGQVNLVLTILNLVSSVIGKVIDHLTAESDAKADARHKSHSSPSMNPLGPESADFDEAPVVGLDEQVELLVKKVSELEVENRELRKRK